MQTDREHWLTRLSLFAVVVVWLVAGFGAFTRLTNAGLGCPDWPGCYGHILVPGSAVVTDLMKPKAWTEMVHRYLAGIVALLTFAVALLAMRVALRRGLSYLGCALALVFVVVFQALLGMWTVTLKLWPVVVSLHLLGGMTLLALLWFVHLKSRWNGPLIVGARAGEKVMAVMGLFVVLVQMALGAWTSTNYAAISCPHFPGCGTHFTHFDFHRAFAFFSPMGLNYEGGVLSESVRQTIQMVHRWGALIVVGYVLFLIFYFRKTPFLWLHRSLWLVLLCVALQVTLGVLTALWQRPILTAVLHHLVSGLLLCAMLSVNYFVFHQTPQRVVR